MWEWMPFVKGRLWNKLRDTATSSQHSKEIETKEKIRWFPGKTTLYFFKVLLNDVTWSAPENQLTSQVSQPPTACVFALCCYLSFSFLYFETRVAFPIHFYENGGKTFSFPPDQSTNNSQLSLIYSHKKQDCHTVFCYLQYLKEWTGSSDIF